MKDIFEGTSQHEYYPESARNEVLLPVRRGVLAQIRDEVREQERRARLQALSRVLLIIVRSRFPTLTRLAKALAWQIKDVAVMNEVLGKVGAAQTTEEATNALISWLPDDDPEE